MNKEKMFSKLIFWTPRILSIIFICFLVVFSFDVFEMELSFLQIIGALFIHNLPSLILLAVLIISWKHEIVGAITFILAGLIYILLLLMRGWYHWSGLLLIALPAFIIGTLFLIGWFKKRKIK